MKKLLLPLLLSLLCLPLLAQRNSDERYLREGAVPVVNGVVVFSKTFPTEGQTRTQTFEKLQQYVQQQIFSSPNTLDQTRWLEQDAEKGSLGAAVEEYIYFKKKNWSTDYARFTYHLIFHIEEAQVTAEMRSLRYTYEAEQMPNHHEQHFTAESFITDKEAVKKNGTLTRIGGKFRRTTIDRVDQIFDEVQSALQ